MYLALTQYRPVFSLDQPFRQIVVLEALIIVTKRTLYSYRNSLCISLYLRTLLRGLRRVEVYRQERLYWLEWRRKEVAQLPISLAILSLFSWSWAGKTSEAVVGCDPAWSDRHCTAYLNACDPVTISDELTVRHKIRATPYISWILHQSLRPLLHRSAQLADSFICVISLLV